MNRVKVALVLLLAVAGASLPCRAQSTPRVLYYWLAPDRVLLWLSPGGEAPVEATYNPSDGKWTLGPPSGAEGEKSQEEWRPVLQEVAQRYDPQVDLQTARDEELLSFAVSKLCGACERADWAAPRLPSMRVYVWHPADAAASVAILKNDDPTGRIIIPFTLVRAKGSSTGMWKPSKEHNDLTPQKLFGPALTPQAARKIFKLKEGEATQDAALWLPAWSQWLEDTLNDSKSVRHIFFTGADGKPQWLWRERVRPEVGLPTTPEHAAAPEKIVAPELPHKGSNERSSWSWPKLALWHYALIALVLLLAGGAWFARVQGYPIGSLLPRPKGRTSPGNSVPPEQPRGRRFSWLRRARQKEVSPPGNASTAQQDSSARVLNLERLHKLTLEHCEATTPHGDPARELKLTALEFVYQLYSEPVFLNKLKSDTADQQKEIVDEYRKQLGVEDADKEEAVKLWIELGKEVQRGEERVSRLDVSDDVRLHLDGDAFDRPRSPEHWPALLFAFQQRLADLVKEKEKLEESLQKLRDGQATFERNKEEELRKKWKATVDKLEEEKKALRTERDQTAAALKSANGTINELEAKVNNLQRDLTEARRNDKSAQTELKILQGRLAEIGKVKEVSRHLRRWLQDYQQNEGNGDVRASALLSALINFSLYQMCFSIVNDERPQLKYLAHNISRSLQAFQSSQWNSSALKEVQPVLAELAPGLESAPEAVGSNESEPATDRALFLGFLNHLKVDTGQNLGRFFLEVDKDGKRFVYVAAT